MTVSNIFAEFDDLHRAELEKRTKAVADQSERRELVVALMKNVVKPFADDVINDGRKRNIAVSVEDRGNDAQRPSYTIQFDSYENKRPINGTAPSIKLTATADCKRVEVAEKLGDLEDPLDKRMPDSYYVEMAQAKTLTDVTAALEGWLRHALTLMAIPSGRID